LASNGFCAGGQQAPSDLNLCKNHELESRIGVVRDELKNKEEMKEESINIFGSIESSKSIE
jgi:uncharacterized small protein (DUF1192 family)